MKSKQRLAKVVALALVLGFSGTYGAMADQIRMSEGESGTIESQIVKGVWLRDGAKLTANNVTFVDDPTNHDEDPTTPDGLGEVAVDSGSTLTMNGGAIKVATDYFTADGGTADITGATVTSGAYANNGTITMKNSTISGRALYAGNVWENNVPIAADGQRGTIYVNGGTSNVALVWGYDSEGKDGVEDGGVYFKNGANVTVQGTKGLPVDGKVLTGVYATDGGRVEFLDNTTADISEIHADNNGIVSFGGAAKVKSGDVYISNNGGVELEKCPDVTFGNMDISKGGYLDVGGTSTISIGDIHVVGNQAGDSSSASTIDPSAEESSLFFYDDTNAKINKLELSKGAYVDLGNNADVTVNTLTSDHAYLSSDASNTTTQPSLTVGDLSLNNGSEMVRKIENADGNNSSVEHEAAGNFTFGRLEVNNSKINFGKESSVTFDSKLSKNAPGLFVTNGGEVNFSNVTTKTASKAKAMAPRMMMARNVAKTAAANSNQFTLTNVQLNNASLKADSGAVVSAEAMTVQNEAKAAAVNGGKIIVKDVQLDNASLKADNEAEVSATTMTVKNGAKTAAENGGIINVAGTINVTSGGSTSVAENSTLNAKSIHVSGDKSTFTQQGKANTAVSNLVIDQGGTASLTDSADAKVDNLTIQNASLNLGNGINTLTVNNKFESNNGLVRTSNGDDKVILASGASKTGDVTVQGEGKDYNSDALSGDSNKVKTLAKVVTTADGKTAASTVNGSEGVINGASVYKVENTEDGDIKVTKSTIFENETNRAITDLAALSLITWRQENNDLNKRLGEIRDSKGDDGVWARMARGEATFKGVKNQYNYYQMGYDKKLNDNWILGGAFSYTDGDNTFHSGTGQTKNSSFAVYGSNLRDDGSFIDLIAKYAHLKNEYDTPLGIGSGDYSTNGFSFSGEYGKRFHMDKFWLEPQVELTWGHVDSVNYSTENGARVHQNGMDSFVGRLGFSLGKDFSHGNVYARASYLYDFDGDVKASMTNGTVSREYREDIGGGWFEFGVGTNLNLGSDTHFYFDLERAEGGSGNVKTPWQWNVGVRYSF